MITKDRNRRDSARLKDMSKNFPNRRAFTICALTGLAISIGSWVVSPFFTNHEITPAMWPFIVLGSLSLPTRFFINIIIGNFLPFFWLTEALNLLCWPAIGALVSRSPHWVKLGIAILVIDIVLVSAIIYALAHVNWTSIIF